MLAEPWLKDTNSLRQDALKLADDSDPRVRFQAALSLAPMQADEVQALSHIALAGAEDIWSRRAVAIASGAIVDRLLSTLLQEPSWWQDGISAGEEALLGELSQLVGKASEEGRLAKILQNIVALPAGGKESQVQRVVLKSLLGAMKLRGITVESLAGAAQDDSLAAGLQTVFSLAQDDAQDAQAQLAIRLQALALLGYDSQALPVLTRLVADTAVQQVRLAAIGALAIRDEIEPWPALLEQFAAESPAFRGAVLSAAVRRSGRVNLLLDAIEDGRIKPAEIDRATAGQLTRFRDKTIRSRAKKLLAAAVPADRQAVLADYQTALQLVSDPKRGKEVFRKQCATCHRVADVGVKVGPDIGDNYAKTKEQLLADIIQPNRAIDSNYMGYLVLTEAGQSFSGLLAAETSTSLTLHQEEDKRVTFSKDEVEELRSTGASLMPDGLEKNIPHQDMADLLSFLKNWRYLDGLTPYTDEVQEK